MDFQYDAHIGRSERSTVSVPCRMRRRMKCLLSPKNFRGVDACCERINVPRRSEHGCPRQRAVYHRLNLRLPRVGEDSKPGEAARKRHDSGIQSTQNPIRLASEGHVSMLKNQCSAELNLFCESDGCLPIDSRASGHL